MDQHKPTNTPLDHCDPIVRSDSVDSTNGARKLFTGGNSRSVFQFKDSGLKKKGASSLWTTQDISGQPAGLDGQSTVKCGSKISVEIL